MTQLTIQPGIGPAPAKAKRVRQKCELRIRAEALGPGEWFRVETTTQRERDDVQGIIGRVVGVTAYREEGTTHMIVKRGGRRK